MGQEKKKDLLNIHVNIQITPLALQSIVGHAKRLAGRTAEGTVRIDTANFVAAMISRFLEEKDFEAYAQEESHYKRLVEADDHHRTTDLPQKGGLDV